MSWLFALARALTPRAWIWIAALVLVAGLYAGHVAAVRSAESAGYRSGVDACEAAHIEATHKLNLALAAANDAAREAAVDYEIQRQEYLDLERRLADEAANDPAGAGAGLGPDSLRRLESIR